MVSESEIMKAIENCVMSEKHKDYKMWTIGVTDDPARRRNEHGQDDNKFWNDWEADSENEARNVEKHFLDKGMKGGTGGPGTADYVYIF